MTPHGRFSRQHHRVRTLVDRRRHVRSFSSCRRRILDHRFQHLRRDDHRPPRRPRRTDDAPLDHRHFFRRIFHAEIAARHHHAVRGMDDLTQLAQRCGLLQLRDQRRPAIDDRLRHGDVGHRLNEGQRHEIDADRQGELQVCLVLVGQRFHRQRLAAHGEALLVGNLARHIRPHARRLAGGGHREDQLAVIDKDRVTDFQLVEDRLVRHGDRLGGVRALGRDEGILALPRHFHLAARKAPDTHFRTLQVRQRGQRPADQCLDLADDLQRRAVILVAAMREVQPEYIGARLCQRADFLQRSAARPEGRNDLGILGPKAPCRHEVLRPDKDVSEVAYSDSGRGR